VKYTLEMAMSDIEGATGSTIGKTIAPLIDRVEAAGPYEVIVYFNSPQAEFAPHWFSSAKGAELPITCKKHVEEVGWEEALVNPILSGPYKYVDHAEGEYLELEALESHWRVVPEYKYLIFREVPEEMTRVAMFKMGDVDIVEVTAETAKHLAGEESASIVSIPGAMRLNMALWGQWLPTVETYDPDLPWLDKRVRQAMSLAINREEIAEYIFSGHARPIATSYSFPWSDEFEPYPYDPDRARELLEEADYGDGFDVELWSFDYPGQAAEMPEVIQAVAGYWEAIGLDTKITPMHIIAAYGNWIVRRTTGKVSGWTFVTPFEPWDNFAKNFYSKWSVVPYYESYECDELFEQVLAGPSMEERDRLARQMTQLLHDEYAMVPLVETDKLYVKNDDKVGDWPTMKWQWMVLNYEYVTHPAPLGTFRLFEP
jgi:peptide/nickel transport system substrate-binding protein